MTKSKKKQKEGIPYKHMPITRRKTLTYLKEKGELTADELAKLLGISAVAVRRHLTKLEADNLVTYNEVQRGMGRPSFVYRLGEAAEDFFPRSYEALAITVLETICELYGKEAVDAIFRLRSEHIIKTYQQVVTGESFDERLEQVVKLREADGYMPALEKVEDDIFILREANCPILNVAHTCGCACDHDQDILESLLDTEVIRRKHIADGDDACIYEIRVQNK